MERVLAQLQTWPAIGRLPQVVLRYAINGGLVFAINMVLAAVVFQVPQALQSPLSRNLANALITEVMIAVAFVIHSVGTWRGRGGTLMGRLLMFHVVSASGVALRLAVFFGLDALGMHWLFSTVGSIAVVIVWNFFGYDRLVFGRVDDEDTKQA